MPTTASASRRNFCRTSSIGSVRAMARARGITRVSVSGLSIAKQLVDAHNGSIRAESAGSGQGTAFIVTLPISGHAGEAARVAASEQPGTEPRLDGVRVLVVDDEEDTRELIGRALEDRGAQITLAANSRDAIPDSSATTTSTCCSPTSRCRATMGIR